MSFSEKDEQKFESIAQKYKLRKEKFEEFKPKKYYNDVMNDVELQKELEGLNDQMKQYNHHDELPKLSAYGIGSHRQKDMASNTFAYSVILALVVGRITSLELYRDCINENRIKLFRLKYFVFLMIPGFTAAFLYLQPQFQPQNRGLFAPLPYELRVKNELDQKMNLYKEVDNILHHDEYPSWADFSLANRRATHRAMDNKIKTFRQKQEEYENSLK